MEAKALNTSQPIIPKEFEVVMELEEKFNRILQKFLDQKRKEVLKVLAPYHRGHMEVKSVTVKGVFEDLTSILDPRKLEAAVKAIVAKILLLGTESVEKELNLNITTTPGFKQTVEERSFTMVKGMTDELATKLRNEVMLGWNLGEGVTEIKARIQKTWDNKNLTDARAETIARTETQMVYNGARYQAAKDSGIPVLKRWNAYFDGRTGVDSKTLNNQTRPIDQDFYDSELNQFIPYPPNRPNCRCRLDIIPL